MSFKERSMFFVVAFIVKIGISYFIAYGISRPVVANLMKESSIAVRENVVLFFGICMFTEINYWGQRLVV